MTKLDWSEPVLSLLKAVQHAGLELVAVEDGEGRHSYNEIDSNKMRLEAFVDVITSVDISWLYIRNVVGDKGTITIVLGNEPSEMIADYSYSSNQLLSSLINVETIVQSLWDDVSCPTVQDDLFTKTKEMTKTTFRSMEIGNDTYQLSADITLADLFDCEMLIPALIRSICILRKELLIHQLSDPEDQALETKLSRLYHSISFSQRNAAFAQRPLRPNASST
jgi:hypothetical protein